MLTPLFVPHRYAVARKVLAFFLRRLSHRNITYQELSFLPPYV